MTRLSEALWPADASVPVLPLTVGELLRQATADRPDHLALVPVAPERDPRVWSYSELLSDAEHAAAWLLDRYQPGEHIAVWAPNVPEWLVLQYGAALASRSTSASSSSAGTASITSPHSLAWTPSMVSPDRSMRFARSAPRR